MKKKKIFYVTFAIIFISLVLAGRFLLKHGYRASEEFSTAEISVNVLKDGAPANGMILISGDCPETELAASDGEYYCQLLSTKAGANHLEINSLAFYNFENDLTHRISLSNEQMVESAPYELAANDKLTLWVVLGNDSVAVTKWDTASHQYEPFPKP